MTEQPSEPRSSLVLYQTEDGRTRVQCRFDEQTVWLTQAQMAELFATTPQNITQHLKVIYDEGELVETATCKPFLQVRQEGSRRVQREVLHYSLPAILAVGYRVRSPRGTQFRQWATARLTEFLVQGFTMDDERLKNPPGPGVPDYFDELLERIRDIRASEARMYLRLRDLLALAADYRASDADTTKLFQIVQNKLHHAVTGMTAPELITARADATLPNMGLTTWKGGTVQRTDVTVAKNYLHADEITELNRIVVMFLDYAEDQTRRKQAIHMADWTRKLDEFLRFNERAVLPDAGRVSREDADDKAQAEFERFATRRRELAEAQGEADCLKALEDLAKERPKRKRRKPKDES
jgi:hypothetical protein